MTKRKAFGFTLIELLVVIAIIAMLAAILVPAVNKALTSAALVQTVSNGKNIYTSAFAGQMDDVVLGGDSSSWPSAGTLPSDTSTEYFINLVTSEVMSVSYDFFSAKGLVAVKSSDEADFRTSKATANAWNVVFNLDTAKEGTTFLFTKNADLATLPAAAAEITLETTPPFGEDGMVVVLKGGAAFSLKGKQLKGDFMNPSQQITDLPIGKF